MSLEQVLPERFGIGGVGECAAHADDGDGRAARWFGDRCLQRRHGRMAGATDGAETSGTSTLATRGRTPSADSERRCMLAREMRGQLAERRVLEEHGGRERQAEAVVQRVGELREGDGVEAVLAELGIGGEIGHGDLELRRDEFAQRRQGSCVRAPLDQSRHRRSERQHALRARCAFLSTRASMRALISRDDQHLRLGSAQGIIKRRECGLGFEHGEARRARHQPFGFGRHAHAAVAPQRPVHRQRAPVAEPGAAARLALRREGVEEGVGGGVVRLPRIAERTGDRAEQQEQVERLGAERSIEVADACDLRRQHGGKALRRLAGDSAVVEQPGGVQHAVETAVTRADVGDERGDRSCVGNVENGMLEARAVRAALRGKLRLQRCVDRLAAGEDDRHTGRTRCDLAREELAEPARAAGDEIDGAVPPRHVAFRVGSLQLAPADSKRGTSRPRG